jgi:hypothetical protein
VIIVSVNPAGSVAAETEVKLGRKNRHATLMKTAVQRKCRN